MTLEQITQTLNAEYAAMAPAIRTTEGDVFANVFQAPADVLEAVCGLQDQIHDLAGEDPEAQAKAQAIVDAIERYELTFGFGVYLEGRKAGAATTARMLLGKDAAGTTDD